MTAIVIVALICITVLVLGLARTYADYRFDRDELHEQVDVLAAARESDARQIAELVNDVRQLKEKATNFALSKMR